jgi:uncharacterized protein (TIGR03435 family)
VVGNNGPKMHAAEDGQGRTAGGPGRLEATKITTQKLADLLARLIGLQVVDATGLEGVFDFTLEWSPDETRRMPTPAESTAARASGPSIFTALQEQLGLRRQEGTGRDPGRRPH